MNIDFDRICKLAGVSDGSSRETRRWSSSQPNLSLKRSARGLATRARANAQYSYLIIQPVVAILRHFELLQDRFVRPHRRGLHRLLPR